MSGGNVPPALLVPPEPWRLGAWSLAEALHLTSCPCARFSPCRPYVRHRHVRQRQVQAGQFFPLLGKGRRLCPDRLFLARLDCLPPLICGRMGVLQCLPRCGLVVFVVDGGGWWEMSSRALAWECCGWVVGCLVSPKDRIVEDDD